MVPTTNVTVNEKGSSDISVRGEYDKRLITATITQTVLWYQIIYNGKTKYVFLKMFQVEKSSYFHTTKSIETLKYINFLWWRKQFFSILRNSRKRCSFQMTKNVFLSWIQLKGMVLAAIMIFRRFSKICTTF